MKAFGTKIRVTMMVVAGLLILGGCGAKASVDFHNDVIGTWVLYHYYENVDGGTDVFFDESNYWTVQVSEDTFSITAEDGSLDNVGGSYTWENATTAELTMNDGTLCKASISLNSKNHNENAQFDIYIEETNMYYILENIVD